MEFEEGNPNKAYRLLLEASEAYESLSIPRRFAETAQNAGYIAIELDDAKAAAHLSKKAIYACQCLSEFRTRSRATAVLAQTLARNREYARARQLIPPG